MTVPDVVYRSLSLKEARKLSPISSDFRTNRVYVLGRAGDEDRVTWTLEEQEARNPISKAYDGGKVGDIISSYGEDVRPENLHFLGAFVGGEVAALAIWQLVAWNDTLWLMDIRTRDADRRRGLASGLLDWLKGVARDEKLRGILVETQTNNYGAVRFYRKRGFQLAGFNDHLYTNEDVARSDVALYLFWECDG